MSTNKEGLCSVEIEIELILNNKDETDKLKTLKNNQHIIISNFGNLTIVASKAVL